MNILENATNINVYGGIMMEIGITDSNCNLICGSTNESDSHGNYDTTSARYTDTRGFHVNTASVTRFMDALRIHMSPNHLFRP
jgi:hypothetical protein